MNKIGFQIKRVSAGASDGITVNDGEWSRKVVDSRDIIKLCDINGGGRFIMFMSFGIDGTYLTVMRPITGRDGDNVAAWMYIPNEIDIDGAAIVDIVAKIKNELIQPQSNATFLERLFAQSYPTAETVKNAASTTEKVYAVRRVGNYPLSTILGVSRYQPYYTKYNAVIIEDADSMRVVDKSVADLSGKKIESTLVFCPPVKKDLPLGVTVSYVENKKRIPFTSPVRALQNDIVRIIFSKNGFNDINYDETIWENRQICGIPKNFDWEVPISVDCFEIMAKTTTGVRNLTSKSLIKVNGKQIKFDNPAILSEREARNAKVLVECNGYESSETEFDFIREKAVSIVLKRKTETLEARIELSDGSDGMITISGKGLRSIKDAPIKGYRMERGWLEYDVLAKWKNICIGFFTALALIALIWGGVKLYDAVFGEDVKTKTHTTSHTDHNGKHHFDNEGEKPGGGSISEEKDKYTAAIEYLDNTEKWKKDEMDTIEGLNGLYDKLNTYRFQEVLTTIHELGNEDIIKPDGQIKYLKAQLNKYANAKNHPEIFSTDGSITIKGLFDKLRNKVAKETANIQGQRRVEPEQRGKKGYTEEPGWKF